MQGRDGGDLGYCTTTPMSPSEDRPLGVATLPALDTSTCGFLPPPLRTGETHDFMSPISKSHLSPPTFCSEIRQWQPGHDSSSTPFPSGAWEVLASMSNTPPSQRCASLLPHYWPHGPGRSPVMGNSRGPRQPLVCSVSTASPGQTVPGARH